jgi:hypothetical protein
VTKETKAEATTLDLAQRISEAILRTTKSCEDADAREAGEDEEVLGQVPKHLRHLYNLLYELADVADEAAKKTSDAEIQFEIVHALFYAAISQNITIDNPTLSEVEICKDWKIIALKEDEAD